MSTTHDITATGDDGHLVVTVDGQVHFRSRRTHMAALNGGAVAVAIKDGAVLGIVGVHSDPVVIERQVAEINRRDEADATAVAVPIEVLP